MVRQSKSAFSLLELSIVLLVISLMLGGILTVITQNARIEKNRLMAEKFDRIRNAMMDYRLANKRLPCPGDITMIPSSTDFGIQGGPETMCNDDVPGANFANAGETVYGGSVPVRTLGLTDEDAYDPWGNMLLYVVDKNMTDSTDNDPFSMYPPFHASIGNITVRDADAGGEVITSRALYIILSHGPNGHGAYMRSGSIKVVGSLNTREQVNCHCDDTGAATAFNTTFYKGYETTSSTDALNSFDDKLMYVMRTEMLSLAEKSTE